MRLIQNLLALGSAASALAAPASMTKRQSTLEGQNLSILPLGDSITYGMGSTTGNAYRASLLDSLTTAGATIDYVGTIQSGSMDDNDNEGRIGWTIEQISGAATDASSAGVEADVVLLHAGTNDATTYGWEEAHVRLGELIETVTSLWPEAKVLVAKIVPSAAQDTQEHIEFFNERVQGVVDEQANDKLSVVDMGSALGPDTDLDDALHPNDQGYEKMAAVWFEGLSAVL